MMKVKTQLGQLRAARGNIGYEKISESTGIDSQQLKELENGEAQSIAFSTLAQLCTFFRCTPSDLFVIDEEEEGIEIDRTPPSAEAIAQAREIIKQGFALAEGMPRRGAAAVLAEFEEVRDRIRGELADLPNNGDLRYTDIKTLIYRSK